MFQTSLRLTSMSVHFRNINVNTSRLYPNDAPGYFEVPKGNRPWVPEIEINMFNYLIA